MTAITTPIVQVRTTRNYKLKCSVCAREYEDDGVLLECSREHESSLLVSHYKNDRFEISRHDVGLFRYRPWLPIVREFTDAAGPITYKSRHLGAFLRLSNLWISFNGYWPEKGAELRTATFKELEAYTVLSRIGDTSDHVLVVASAGNTASAFAYVCSKHKIPCLIIIPASALISMQFDHILDTSVRIVVLTDPADYNDAIRLANSCARHPGFVSEGGVKNVARRDGIGTTILNAFEALGRLPDFYFQAIGSGTGAIAAKEASMRVANCIKQGSTLPKLMLSQNLPFAPMYQSWKMRSRELCQLSPSFAKAKIRETLAKVLSNVNPPYSVRGGVYDSVVETEGQISAVANEEVLRAIQVFAATEGIDIEPAAGVAVANLINSVKSRSIPRTHMCCFTSLEEGFADGLRK